jgi:hypothetical protein
MGKHCWPGGLEVPVEPDAGAGYRLAAIWSFYLPYAPRLQQPGYNVLARVPFSEFESMSLTWGTLGCEKLGCSKIAPCLAVGGANDRRFRQLGKRLRGRPTRPGIPMPDRS